MCGIVGFTGKRNIQKLSSFLDIIEHRGRDGRTTYDKDSVHIGMNRLAIIDLSKNLYPMRYKKYVLIFNGEIYNHKELRKSLRRKQIVFHTLSDAEVILPLYDLYGIRAFSLLEGMFAICIYDTARQLLMLSRDKSGEKPLYYMQDSLGLSFASEIKVLLSERKTKRLDLKSVLQYLTQGSVFAPDTLISNIKKVAPSECVAYSIKHHTLQASYYWEPAGKNINTHHRDDNDYVNQLEKLLKKSVAYRMIADVPVGCFLSGGVDSSLVTLFASQIKPNLRTYSVSFPGHTAQDESEYASYVAEQLHTIHTAVQCTAESVYELIGHIGTLIDEPIIDPAVLPTFLMAQEARKQVKVALTGEGADELFGGYERYKKQLDLDSVRGVLSKFPYLLSVCAKTPVNRIQSLSKNLIERYSSQLVWNNNNLCQLLNKEVVLASKHPYLQQFGLNDPLLSMQLTDYRGYMAEQLLMKIDKSTMATNLEARAPYLDSHVVSFAFGLPTNQKLCAMHGKYVLKKLAERYFPASFVWRPKHGFDIPLRNWFRNDLRFCVEQSVKNLADYSQVFQVEYYKHIVHDHMYAGVDHSGKIWSMIVLTNWMKTHRISL
jgi:asparagine synthase (glutamine-hydrolysing)